MRTITIIALLLLSAPAFGASLWSYSHLDAPLTATKQKAGGTMVFQTTVHVVNSPRYQTLTDCTTARQKFIDFVAGQHAIDPNFRRDLLAGRCMEEPQ